MNLEFLTVDQLRWVLVSAFGAALLVLVYTLAAAPTKVAPRLGMRGYKRTRSLEQNEMWRAIEPFVRWLGVRVSGMISDDLRERMDRQIVKAGDILGLTPEEYVALSIMSCFGGIGFGYLFGWLSEMGPILVLLLGPLGAAMPYLAIAGEAESRLKAINRGLPYAIDLLALAMSAGQDFPGAVRQVVEKSSDPNDPMTEEFARILQELQVGRTRRQALIAFSDRVPLDSAAEFVNAVVQAEERGNPVAGVLQIQASVSRQRRTVKAEESASQAAVKMVGPLFLVFFCIMLLVLGPLLLKIAAQN